MLLFQHGNLQVFKGKSPFIQASGREGAGVLLTLPDGRLLVSRELRHAVGQEVWGLPGGMLTPGETPEGCARRELREEVGAEVGDLHYLGSVYPQPGVLDRLSHLYFARVERLVESEQEDDEQIAATAISPRELHDRLLAGEYADGELPCALYFALLRGLIQPYGKTGE